MRCDFFTIPVHGDRAGVEELNRLLVSARILTVERQFVANGGDSFWSVCVVSQAPDQRPQPAGKRATTDYREILSEADFAVYARLRELRKEIAGRDGIPPYSVFTNEQLADIVRRRVSTSADLRTIDGVGEARVEKYGPAFLDMMTAMRRGSEGEKGEPQPSDGR